MAEKVSKEKSEKNVTFAKGGDNHMFGPQKAGPEKPGTTAHDTSGSGGDFAKGGSGKMFGFTGSMPAQAGKTSAR
jgi:hypothetical protein